MTDNGNKSPTFPIPPLQTHNLKPLVRIRNIIHIDLLQRRMHLLRRDGADRRELGLGLGLRGRGRRVLVGLVEERGVGVVVGHVGGGLVVGAGEEVLCRLYKGGGGGVC